MRPLAHPTRCASNEVKAEVLQQGKELRGLVRPGDLAKGAIVTIQRKPLQSVYDKYNRLLGDLREAAVMKELDAKEAKDDRQTSRRFVVRLIFNLATLYHVFNEEDLIPEDWLCLENGTYVRTCLLHRPNPKSFHVKRASAMFAYRVIHQWHSMRPEDVRGHCRESGVHVLSTLRQCPRPTDLCSQRGESVGRHRDG